ncbi:MAG: hypothetical protein FJ304_22465 [Planctomycetes bacterium]|nr:hypothetical protein [Planctomycetota bacterium]
MSTHINDLASAGSVQSAVYPNTYGSAFNGSTLDMISSDGPCFAVQHVGAFEESNTWTGRVEQSADGSSWSAISGAAFAAVTAANNVQVIRFERTARYVRYAASLTGSTAELGLAVVIGALKKTF